MQGQGQKPVGGMVKILMLERWWGVIVQQGRLMRLLNDSDKAAEPREDLVTSRESEPGGRVNTNNKQEHY